MILKTILNYLLLPICTAVIFAAAFLFRGNGMICLIIPVLQILLSWFNYRCSKKWQMVLILEIHLLIATIAGFSLGGYLYLKYISGDSDSMMLFMLDVIVGAVVVLMMGLFVVLLKYFSLNRARKP